MSENIERNENAETTGLPTISPARRKQLNKSYEIGMQKSNQKSYDYAIELLVQCVSSDPANVEYLQGLIKTLKEKYEKARGKGHPMAFLKMMGPKGAMKKAMAKEDWKSAIESGVKAMVWNPWDFPTLSNLVKATKAVGLVDPPLLFLKLALEAGPKDVAINRFCGTMLEELDHINEAYQCWRRVGELKPGDEEAERMQTKLTIARTIKETGYTAAPPQGAASTVKVRGDSGETLEMTQEERIEYQIRQQPKNASLYLQLGDMFIQAENFEKAQDVLKRGVDSCGPGDGLQDKLEDAQIRWMRQKMSKVDRNSEEWKKLRLEMNETELGIWKNRCDRYPNNLGFKYDLGLRYQMKGDNDEAIKQFQISKKEPRRAGLSCLALGQCFQGIKQYSLAMANYQEAIEKIPDRDAENRKKSLYLAGKLAMSLKEYDQANEFLTRLADMDFSYKDVSELLAKVEELRQG
ncbi:MAG: hypothetical protein Q4C70_05135 [Planctomycetia bacterium]|nr:hypothetical protein [Planctomycetia bacterium]